MRITKDNVQTAVDSMDDIEAAIESFRDAANVWLEFQEDRTGSDPEEIRDARDEMEAAIEELAGLGVKL